MGTAEEHLEKAKECMEQANALMGESKMSDREFLESMARSDELVDHPNAMDGDGTCGHCGMQIVMAQAARELLREGDVLDGIAKWSDLSKKKWEAAKYFQFYHAEKEAGRDPHQSFEERGWEM